MTAEQYLSARGWTIDEEWWSDPVRGNLVDVDVALAVQRARDADDERKAWVAFAAASQSVPFADGGQGANATAGAANDGDAMLAAYRERFAVEVTS